MEEQERHLLERAQKDPLAFAALYDLYADRVYNYIYQRMGNHADAEDLTARTFLKAFVHLQGFRYRGIPVSAWLYRIAHNAVANWHRDGQRHQMVSLDAVADRGKDEDSLEQVVQARQDKKMLLEAMRRLPADRQQLLILKFGDDLTNAEIGAIMDRSEGAVKSLYHRTLLELRECLRENGAD